MLPFVTAKWFSVKRTKPTRLIAIHTTETPCEAGGAMRIANYFKNVKDRKVSAHFVIDPTAVVQCVRVGDTAYGAPGANSMTIHNEFTCMTNSVDWDAPEVRQMLFWGACNAAQQVGLLRFLGVPFEVVLLSPVDVRKGKAGFVGHHTLTLATGKGSHIDPGPRFPWPDFLGGVNWWIEQFNKDGWPPANFV